MKAKPIILSEDLISLFKERVMLPIYTTCHYWTGSLDDNGYGRIKFCRDGRKITYFAHRISYQLNNGDVPSHLSVCHKCDNPACVNPDHLWLGTLEDNLDDRNKKGRARYAFGEQKSKFKESQILAILKDTRDCRSISIDHPGMTPDNVRAIKKRKSWRHVIP